MCKEVSQALINHSKYLLSIYCANNVPGTSQILVYLIPGLHI